MDVLQILSSSLKQLHVPVDPLNQAIWVTGAVILTMFSLRLMSFLYTHLIMDMDMGTFGAKKGGYALVTGASEGIGRAICFELARRGFHLIIVARTESRLEALKADLTALYPHCASTVVTPLDCFDVPTSCAVLQGLCKQLPVTLLVNNVGCEHGEPEPLCGKSFSDMQAIVDLNITFNAQLCRAALASLLANAKGLGCKACIVNLSSVAASVEQPCVTTYSAAKAFNTTFSRALAKEGRRHHGGALCVTCLRPAFVESAMSGLKAEGLKGLVLGVVTPAVFARSAVAKFGAVDDISPVMQHDIACWVMTSLPQWVMERVLYVLSMVRINKRISDAAKGKDKGKAE